MDALDLFAGPGGWDVAARQLGIDPLGVELDADACATREAAGHRTLMADVAELDPHEFDGIRLLIGSPPCPTFSAAGKRAGVADLMALGAAAAVLARTGTMPDVQVSEPETALVLEPLRYAVALLPDAIALEQVPSVLPLWRAIAHELYRLGYATWSGELNAADYGTPQVRRRAILMARRDRSHVLPPPPTHCDRGAHLTIGGEQLEPWVTMAEALGWGMDARPSPTVIGGRNRQGGHDPLDGGSGSRATAQRARESGRWIVKTRGESGRGRDSFDPTAEPSRDSLQVVPPVGMNTGRDWQQGGSRDDAQVVPTSEPAPTITGKLRGRWVYERPATTVAGDPRIAQPGHKRDRGNQGASGRMEGAERVELHEAGVLQGFPADYPWSGRTRTSLFQQVGNAVPPPLAHAILSVLTDA